MQEAPLLVPSVIGEPAFVTYSWVAMAFLLGVSILVRSSIKVIPQGVQNIVEAMAEMLLNLAESNIGHMGKHFFPLISTLGMYIMVCNFLGLIPGFEAPTSNINTTEIYCCPAADDAYVFY
ncbi:MAG: F0F1 ATP synthase subunit A [Nitrospirae bacterium]|nr:F0F1 ATP synthase subunit A [Nitrospirota bacterium]